MIKNFMNQKVSNVTESLTIEISDRVKELERNGTHLIKLQTGDPNFDTPNAIIEAASRAMHDGHTHYTSSRGLLDLRNALSEKLKNENNIM